MWSKGQLELPVDATRGGTGVSYQSVPTGWGGGGVRGWVRGHSLGAERSHAPTYRRFPQLSEVASPNPLAEAGGGAGSLPSWSPIWCPPSPTKCTYRTFCCLFKYSPLRFNFFFNFSFPLSLGKGPLPLIQIIPLKLVTRVFWLLIRVVEACHLLSPLEVGMAAGLALSVRGGETCTQLFFSFKNHINQSRFPLLAEQANQKQRQT